MRSEFVRASPDSLIVDLRRGCEQLQARVAMLDLLKSRFKTSDLVSVVKDLRRMDECMRGHVAAFEELIEEWSDVLRSREMKAKGEAMERVL